MPKNDPSFLKKLARQAGGKKRLIVVGGPTASGKTAIAIRLAQHFQTEILSADSRQFYREMSIGTAKPTAEELAAAPHHFVNSLNINDLYTVGDFERDGLKVLQKIFQEKDEAILVGGSGLFIRAICDGLDDFPPVPDGLNKDLRRRFADEGIGFLQKEIERLDPVTAAKIDLQNPMRLLRAVAVCLASGLPYSSFLGKKSAAREFDTVYICLDWPRPELYARIEARVDAMIADGLEAEARELLPFRHLQTLQTVGYPEFFDYFDGKTTLTECISLIKQHSRNYAKRQSTWFRKEAHWRFFHPDEWAAIVSFLEK